VLRTKRWLLALSSVPVLLVGALSVPLLMESPRYFVANGRLDEARHVLAEIAVRNGKQPLQGVLVPPPSNDSALSTRPWRAAIVLLSSSLRRTTLLVWTLYVVVNFCYYGLVMSTAEFFASLSGMDEIVVLRSAFITSLAEAPAVILLAVLLWFRVGRRQLQVAMVLTCEHDACVMHDV
jgi:putative MFS transporter